MWTARCSIDQIRFKRMIGEDEQAYFRVESIMPVTVTGAAGRLGRRTCQALQQAGIAFLAVDKAPGGELPFPVRPADLLDPQAAYEVLEGSDTLVHLANHPGYRAGNGQRVFNENVAMDMNAFQAAVELGVGRIIFASSVQVIAGPGDRCEGAGSVAYLPLDGEAPAKPGNPYALSKRVGEVMLEYFAAVYGVATVALRLPGMRGRERLARRRIGSPSPAHLAQGLSYLSFEDAGRLIAAIVRSPLQGSRTYMPSAPLSAEGKSVSEIIREYYKGVPLRRPLEEIASLVDNSRIEKETGWRPRDLIGSAGMGEFGNM